MSHVSVSKSAEKAYQSAFLKLKRTCFYIHNNMLKLYYNIAISHDVTVDFEI